MMTKRKKKPDQWQGTPYRPAFEQFKASGETLGLLLLADWLDDHGERPALVELLRQVAAHHAECEGTVRFFYANAGSSYDPTTETPEHGSLRWALKLAEAELWFRSLESEGEAECEWVEDTDADRSWLDGEGGPEGGDDRRPLWGCIVRRTAHGESVAESLWGIDLGPDPGVPYGSFGAPKEPYTRVVRAELARQLMSHQMPSSGYAWELPHPGRAERWRPGYWVTIDDEEWDCIVYAPVGTEVWLGVRHIDGTPHNVWIRENGTFVAQVGHG